MCSLQGAALTRSPFSVEFAAKWDRWKQRGTGKTVA